MPVSRDGMEVSKEPVAGNFGEHSNIWQMALTMWQLITVCETPLPPCLTDVKFGSRSIDNTYGISLGDDKYKDVDANLRETIARCLKHDPRERPKLEVLLPPAQAAARLRARDREQVNRWVQAYIYDA
ncbi:hypothetical protein PG984_008128 [Apiospora sp. TS-2023a]